MTLQLRFVENVNTAAWKVQYTGIVAGIVVYIITVLVVIGLLVLGGSFKRIKEQSQQYKKHGKAAFKKPSNRAKLYDHLIEAKRKLPEKPELPGGQLVGAFCLIRYLDQTQDAEALFQISSGSPCFDHGSYDAENDVWGFLPYGPFESLKEMSASPAMDTQKTDSKRLVIVDKYTEKVIGSISILNNQPQNLGVHIGEYWVTPAYQGKEYIWTEAFFILLTYLFSLDYRRVETSFDTEDSNSRKRAEGFGFFFEGTLRKHMVVRDSSRDTAVYSILNNEWEQISEKARKALKKFEDIPAHQVWMKKQAKKEENETFQKLFYYADKDSYQEEEGKKTK